MQLIVLNCTADQVQISSNNKKLEIRNQKKLYRIRFYSRIINTLIIVLIQYTMKIEFIRLSKRIMSNYNINK